MGYCAIGCGKVKITADLTAKELAIIGEDNDMWCFHFEKGEFVTYSGCVAFECENPECGNSCCVYCGNGRCHAAAVRSEYRGRIEVDAATNVVRHCKCFLPSALIEERELVVSTLNEMAEVYQSIVDFDVGDEDLKESRAKTAPRLREIAEAMCAVI